MSLPPLSVEWRPRVFNGLCIFTVAVLESAQLLGAIEHNAKYARAPAVSTRVPRARTL